MIEEQEIKHCPRCNKDKPESEFISSKYSGKEKELFLRGIADRCKDCDAKYYQKPK